MDDKRRLRERVRALMEAQPGEARRAASAAIAEKLFALEAFRAAPAVCFYVSMPHEVDTHAMIDRALALGKHVSVPRCDMKTVELTFYRLRDRALLEKGTWGIYEPPPSPADAVHPREAACVVVPGVAFDAEGNRVGNGKGFYDRFLKRLAPGALKIGLAFGFQMVPHAPVETHDVRLDMVLTE